jgi:hypothetical protein
MNVLLPDGYAAAAEPWSFAEVQGPDSLGLAIAQMRRLRGEHGAVVRQCSASSLMGAVEGVLARMGSTPTLWMSAHQYAGLCDAIGCGSLDRMMLRETDQLICFGERAGDPVVVNIALSGTGTASLKRSGESLATLRARPLPPALDAAVPRLLRTYSVCGRYAVMQTRLAGRAIVPRWRPQRVFGRHLSAALAFLEALQSIPAPVSSTEEWFDTLHDLPNRYSDHREAIAPAVHAVTDWLVRKPFTPVITHGDFGFHNLLFDGQGQLTGVVDWERAFRFRHPRIDALHLFMTAADHARLCSSDRFIMSLWEPGRADDRIRQVQRLFLDATGTADEDLPFLGVLLWFGFLLFNSGEYPAQDAAWRQRMVTGPARALPGISRFSLRRAA